MGSCCRVFHSVRRVFGVTEEVFRKAWSEGQLKLKLNEGGSSNAFFFFSPCSRFIVKSVTNAELRLLRRMARKYAEHMADQPQSFLVRVYGVYKLVAYGTEFNFFVMENVLNVNYQIHERYDIKGSWVDRNFKRPKKGESVTCALCNEKYVVGSHRSACSQVKIPQNR